MTRYDLVDILDNDEYKSFGRFLQMYMHPIGEKMIRIPSNNKRYKTLLCSFNVYSEEDILKVAEERLTVVRAMPLRFRTLRKVIDYIKIRRKKNERI